MITVALVVIVMMIMMVIAMHLALNIQDTCVCTENTHRESQIKFNTMKLFKENNKTFNTHSFMMII
jgi:hypothetical protein